MNTKNFSVFIEVTLRANKPWQTPVEENSFGVMIKFLDCGMKITPEGWYALNQRNGNKRLSMLLFNILISLLGILRFYSWRICASVWTAGTQVFILRYKIFHKYSIELRSDFLRGHEKVSVQIFLAYALWGCVSIKICLNNQKEVPPTL